MEKNNLFLILCTLTFINFIKAGHYLYCTDKDSYSCKINFSLIAYEYDKIDFPDVDPTFKLYKISDW